MKYSFMTNKLFTSRGGLTVLSKSYWDVWYAAAERKNGASAWGNPTKLMLEEITKAVGELSGKRIVDLGAGDGRYSVHFAMQGARVDHVDYSSEAHEDLGKLADAHGASKGMDLENARDKFIFNGSKVRNGWIISYRMDAKEYTEIELPSQAPATLVFSSGLAEYLHPDELRVLVQSWQNATAPGGANVIVYLIKGPGVSEIPGEHPNEPGMIESLYDQKKWCITFTTDTGNPQEETRPDTHVIINQSDGEQELTSKSPATHIHRIRRFVAKKEG